MNVFLQGFGFALAFLYALLNITDLPLNLSLHFTSLSLNATDSSASSSISLNKSITTGGTELGQFTVHFGLYQLDLKFMFFNLLLPFSFNASSLLSDFTSELLLVLNLLL